MQLAETMVDRINDILLEIGIRVGSRERFPELCDMLCQRVCCSVLCNTWHGFCAIFVPGIADLVAEALRCIFGDYLLFLPT